MVNLFLSIKVMLSASAPLKGSDTNVDNAIEFLAKTNKKFDFT